MRGHMLPPMPAPALATLRQARILPEMTEKQTREIGGIDSNDNETVQ